MKNFFPLILSFLVALLAVSSSSAQFAYTNPSAGGKYVKAGSAILLRSAKSLDVSSVFEKKIFTVTGSLSGKHTFQIKLLGDGKSIILQPDKQFSGGELVTVTTSSDLRFADEKKFQAESFSFQIEPAYTPAQKAILADAIAHTYAD